MRFMKGARVEVLDGKDLPLGCWRCGEIISSNGHSSTIRYYGQSRKNTLAKVSDSFVRPCPPHLGIQTKWVSGDVVEVFSNYCWKMAKVIKPLGGGSCVVRILGTSEELRVDALETRMRQSWHNGKWVVIRQVSCVVTDEWKEAGQVQVETPKRKSSHLYRIAGDVKKRRVGTKQRNGNSEVLSNRTELPELIDVSLRIQDTTAGSSCSISHSGSNDGDYNDSCSIGSCSISNVKCSESSPKVRGPVEDISGRISDAESCSHVRHEEQKKYDRSSPVKGSEAEVHTLELCAYRRTMEALHASGALSWEQESLMSNLRVFLNISSEEHLKELKALLSANNDSQHR